MGLAQFLWLYIRCKFLQESARPDVKINTLGSIKAIAISENVTERYVARVLRDSLLAPGLIERILAGRQPVTLAVRQLLDPPPIDWAEQPRHFGFSS
ncbi:MAG: hypothetical protein P4L92_01100 [Rudaea sp.]|nr:hypothetical protein [Rudaea sp.]